MAQSIETSDAQTALAHKSVTDSRVMDSTVLDSAALDGIVSEQPLSSKPIAMVAGEPMAKKPNDLFIPPDALQVFLNAFEGPLDLLLYLIRKHKFNILDLPVSKITDQYMEYVDLMKELNLDLAAEYLLMAAILAEIKSRMLLPVQVVVDDEEHDPRADLIQRLKEYESYKQAALDIDALPRLERDQYTTRAIKADNLVCDTPLSDVTLKDLSRAFLDVMKKVQRNMNHHIQRESLSTRARMSEILALLKQDSSLMFWQLFQLNEGRAGAVVSFLAILQLCKEQLIGIATDNAASGLNVFLLNENTPSLMQLGPGESHE